MYIISNDGLDSIKRVMSTNYYIIKTSSKGLMLLTLNDLESKQFTIQDLLEVKDGSNYTDSLNV